MHRLYIVKRLQRTAGLERLREHEQTVGLQTELESMREMLRSEKTSEASLGRMNGLCIEKRLQLVMDAWVVEYSGESFKIKY